MLIAMPNKGTHVAVIDAEKGSIFDIKSKKLVRSIPKWGGICTRDGKTGLYAPSRCAKKCRSLFLIFLLFLFNDFLKRTTSPHKNFLSEVDSNY